MSDTTDTTLCVRSGGYTHSLVKKVIQVPQATHSVTRHGNPGPHNALSTDQLGRRSLTALLCLPPITLKPPSVPHHQHNTSLLSLTCEASGGDDSLEKALIRILKLRNKHHRGVVSRTNQYTAMFLLHRRREKHARRERGKFSEVSPNRPAVSTFLSAKCNTPKSPFCHLSLKTKHYKRLRSQKGLIQANLQQWMYCSQNI